MHIEKVLTATKVADVILDEKNKKYFQLVWDKSKVDVYKMEVDRIYLIIENGIIKKIGGSGCEGGLIKTITTYRDSSLSGKPSPRTIGVPYLINQSLQKGNKIEIYGILGELVMTDIKGLFGMNTKLASPNYKYMEKCCLDDYYSEYGTYPDWNFQEKNEKWPDEVTQLHLELLNKKTKKELINENTN